MNTLFTLRMNLFRRPIKTFPLFLIIYTFMLCGLLTAVRCFAQPPAAGGIHYIFDGKVLIYGRAGFGIIMASLGAKKDDDLLYSVKANQTQS
jgi:hypothetical protein